MSKRNEQYQAKIVEKRNQVLARRRDLDAEVKEMIAANPDFNDCAANRSTRLFWPRKSNF